MAFVEKTCPVCGISYHVPEPWEREQRRLGAQGGWWCPNGHQRVYSQSTEDKLRRERDQAIQRVAMYQDQYQEARDRAEAAERRVSAAKGQVTKLKKRAANGVCPCCNRTFADLARHMAGKHPGFVAEPTADEHVH